MIKEKDLIHLNEELYRLAWMPNKADANPVASQLRRFAYQLHYQDLRDREGLLKAISAAEFAAGDARRKEYWLRHMEAVWLPLESKLMQWIATVNVQSLKRLEL